MPPCVRQEREKEEELVVRGNVEIDMRRPFSSVKEAIIMLFGESVLASEIYGNKLKEMQIKSSANGGHQAKIKTLNAELEETKQSLKKATQEGDFMAYYLKSLKQEVEETKRELRQLKAREIQNQLSDDFEIHEEIKFVENSTRTTEVMEPQREDDGFELQKRRSVKFASPPSLTKVMVSKDISEVKVESNSLKKKTKGKNLFPWIGGTIFSRKKRIQEGYSPRT